LEGLTVTEKIEEFCRLLQFPEVQEVLKEIFRTSLVESNVFTRLNLIEEHLGADEYHCIGRDLDYENGISEFDEERQPMIKLKDQVTAIYKAIDSKETVVETTVLGGNKTEMRARLLFDKLKITPFVNGKRFLKGPDVSKWLLSEIDIEYRTTKTGSRQAAKDVMEKTRELFPDEISYNPDSSKINRKRAYNVIEYIERKEM
jgi:hypothetical protein